MKKILSLNFFHFLDVNIVTSWLLDRRDCNALDVPKKINKKTLLDFKCFIPEVS